MPRAGSTNGGITPLQIITKFFLETDLTQAQLALDVAETILADRRRQARDEEPPAPATNVFPTDVPPASLRRARAKRGLPATAVVTNQGVVDAAGVPHTIDELPPQTVEAE